MIQISESWMLSGVPQRSDLMPVVFSEGYEMEFITTLK